MRYHRRSRLLFCLLCAGRRYGPEGVLAFTGRRHSRFGNCRLSPLELTQTGRDQSSSPSQQQQQQVTSRDRSRGGGGRGLRVFLKEGGRGGGRRAQEAFSIGPQRGVYKGYPYIQALDYVRGPSMVEYATSNMLSNIPAGSMTSLELNSVESLMTAWIRLCPERAARNVESLLKRVVDERRAGNRRARPTERMYSMVIDAWAKSGRKLLAAERAQLIVDEMERRSKEVTETTSDSSGDPSDNVPAPTTYAYNALLNAWSKSEEPWRAAELLRRMEDGSKGPSIAPDVVSYTTVISGLCSGRYRDADEDAALARRLLHTMQTRGPAPNAFTYNVVVQALSRSGQVEACLALVDYMLEYSHLIDNKNNHNPNQSNETVSDVNEKPHIVNHITVNSVLHCLKTYRPDDTDLFDRWFYRIETDFGVTPDLGSYRIAMAFYTAQGMYEKVTALFRTMKLRGLNMECQRLEGRPEPPSSKSTPSNKREDPRRSVHQSKHKHAKATPTIALDPPNDLLQASVMALIAKGQAEKAEAYLMEAVSSSTSSSLSPSNDDNQTSMNKGDLHAARHCFSVLIEHYADAGKAESAERVLRSLLEYNKYDNENRRIQGQETRRVGPYLFMRVMQCYTHTRHPRAGTKGAALLSHLSSETSGSGSSAKATPNVHVYNCVLAGYAQSGELRRSAAPAEDLLRRLELCPDVEPTPKTYALTMSCLARSSEPGKVRRALGVLRRMQEVHHDGKTGLGHPRIYSILFNAAAFTNHDDADEEREAFDICRTILRELRAAQLEAPNEQPQPQPHEIPDTATLATPNSMLYGYFLKACSKLHVPRSLREEEAIFAFRTCCEAGQVNAFVLAQLRFAILTSTYAELVPDVPPPEWSRNVPKKVLGGDEWYKDLI